MALVPLATKGNYFHVYDFRVKAGRGDEFVELFNKFDLYEDPEVKGADGQPITTRVLTIMLAEEY